MSGNPHVQLLVRVAVPLLSLGSDWAVIFAVSEQWTVGVHLVCNSVGPSLQQSLIKVA